MASNLLLLFSVVVAIIINKLVNYAMGKEK